jgi:putative hydrolase of the HAD superfamily
MTERIEAVIFDVYETLLSIEIDEEQIDAYKFLSEWLSYHGTEVCCHRMRSRYRQLVNEALLASGSAYPDIDIGKVFSRILYESKGVGPDAHNDVAEFALLFRILTTNRVTMYDGVPQLLTRFEGR